jgi:hypothetical protein
MFSPTIGCGAAGEPDFSRVKLDMTEAEVVDILGRPTREMTHPQFPSLRMLEWNEDSRVVFENGKVDAVVVNDETILDRDAAGGKQNRDELAEAEINGANAAEARAWLAVPGNAIFEGNKADVTALAESFYQAGCPKVVITGIEHIGGTAVSASMVVVLPTDAAQRAAAFKVENEFAQKHGEDGEQDQGQKYLMLGFD